MFLFFEKGTDFISLVGHSLQHLSRDNQRTFEWNRSQLCSAPISSHNTRNIRVCKGRDLIKLTAETSYLKTIATSSCISFAARFSRWRRQWTKTDSYNATETSLQAYQHIPESDANSEGESGGSGKKFRGTPLPAIKEESNFTAMNKVFLWYY